MAITAWTSTSALCLTGRRGQEEKEATLGNTSILPAVQQGQLASGVGALRLVRGREETFLEVGVGHVI